MDRIRLPGPARTGSGDSARVRGLVAGIVEDDIKILVTELACTEPGCPPTETVIALMHPGAPQQFKIHKPLAQVTRADVEAALAGPHAH
ncbi:hypothetical protein ACFVJS_12610 [Nocardioides sp. NPDC057772]|uniref:hypothetical protein n=1 Tax=Nocardioides sp. NPDC057772 TaxID=3346245 RepID=UPI003670E9A0